MKRPESATPKPMEWTLRPWTLPAGFVVPTVPDDLDDLTELFATLAAKDELPFPLPGGGHTVERWAALAEVSAVDLSLGRLMEGHADAVAILAEAERPPPPAGVLGVWAARRPGADLAATRHGNGWHLHGRKAWASGARMLTHALVTASTGDGDRLFEVPVDGAGAGVRAVPGTWPAVGMAMSQSLDVEFDIALGPDAAVGPPGWYVHRPGFWFGSVGVAACWLGGAWGLVRALQTDLGSRPQPDGHQLARLGAAAARCASLARDLAWAGARIDADPTDGARQMGPVAAEVRHLVEAGCIEVVTEVGRAGGAAPLCHDRAQARRLADLPVYIRQHHTDRDAEAMGRSLLSGREDR